MGTIFRSRSVALVLLMLVVDGCATGYQPAGATGGYTDEKLDESHYRVRFAGNGYASKARVYYFWLYRCAELTRQKGYFYFGLAPIPTAKPATPVTPAPPAAPAAPADASPAPSKTGYDGGAPSLQTGVYQPNNPPHFIKTGHGGGGGGTPIYYPGGTISTWSDDMIVSMYYDTSMSKQVLLLSAQVILDELGAYVKSDGASLPPSPEALVADAVIATPETKALLVLRAGVSAVDPALLQNKSTAEYLPNPVYLMVSKYNWASIADGALFVREDSVTAQTAGNVEMVLGRPDGATPADKRSYWIERYRVNCTTFSYAGLGRFYVDASKGLPMDYRSSGALVWKPAEATGSPFALALKDGCQHAPPK